MLTPAAHAVKGCTHITPSRHFRSFIVPGLGALRRERAALLLAAIAGATTVFAFAPFSLPWLPVVTLGLLFSNWQHAQSGPAARTGFAFGIGLFGAGASWVYVALNTFGGMPASLAAIGTAFFCVYLSVFPAMAGWLATRWTAVASWPRALAIVAMWPLAEWARSLFFSAFPWLGMGYAQLSRTSGSALAGYAPVGGVWLVSLAIAIIACVFASAIDALCRSKGRQVAMMAILVAGVIAGGIVLQEVIWTSGVGPPVAISLVQGNVTQDQKFDPELRDDTFRLYTDMARASRGRIVVLPESALPAFADEVPDTVWQDLRAVANGRSGAVVTGIFTTEPPRAGEEGLRYYNSVLSLDAGDSQRYRKRHLVPFGEMIPFDPVIGWFIRSVLSIPLANQASGEDDQAPLLLAGQKIAINICYEDAFGSLIRTQAAAATLLVNVTNDAWYGRSLAAEQHNQIAAMRALETGRPLLRATNTGITSVIDEHGREIARLPWFTRGILEVSVTGREGLTPYVRWGDALFVLIALMLFGAGVMGARQGEAKRRNDSADRQ